MPDAPLVVYDGDCTFCRTWIVYWRMLVGERVHFEPYQTAAERHPEVPLEAFRKGVQFIGSEAERASNAEAVFRMLQFAPGRGWLLGAYQHVPGFAPVTELGYRIVAQHRSAFYHVTRILWGRAPEPPQSRIAAELFFRALGIIYLIAFVSLAVQVKGLIGSGGISPLTDFLKLVHGSIGASGYWQIPGIFWLNASDGFLVACCWLGAVLAIAVALGFLRRPLLVILLVLYLSLCTAGQDFLSFQWDVLLLESGFLAIFLVPTQPRIWLFRWLLFRLMFMSGIVKLISKDPEWANWMALTYHYETQPLPTPIAWYLYQLPVWFQKLSVGFVFAVEVGAPFLIFLPRRPRMAAAWIFIALQVLILLSGNYTFFNWLAIALCVFLFDDAALRRIARVPQRVAKAVPAVSWILVCTIVPLSVFQLLEMFGARPPEPVAIALHAVAPFRILNTYGLFAVMTTAREEIEVEGSEDGVTWKPYPFRYKPDDLRRAPPWVAPHQPRLDWQMWFAALGSYQQNQWFVNFMTRLLQGAPDVVKLMAGNPFPAHPPRYVRARIYDYHFTTAAERRATGAWWKRQLRGEYFPAVSLRKQ